MLTGRATACAARDQRRGWLFVARMYVALGDSMSIDAYAGGAGRGAASLLHRNRDADFPDWAGRDLHGLGYAVRDLTRDGATSADVLHTQLPLVTTPPDLVTITMGGNDLMSAYGDTAAAQATIASVADLAGQVLGRLRAVAGSRVPVVLTTVYDPSDGTGAVPGHGLPPWSDGPGLVRALNAALTQVAHRHGALVADVHARFLGHGAAVGDPGQPHSHPRDRRLWYCGVIEPNAWGAHEIRCAWWEALEAAGAH
jgi:lysophospholipase L1-like esterase